MSFDDDDDDDDEDEGSISSLDDIDESRMHGNSKQRPSYEGKRHIDPLPAGALGFILGVISSRATVDSPRKAVAPGPPACAIALTDSRSSDGCVRLPLLLSLLPGKSLS